MAENEELMLRIKELEEACRDGLAHVAAAESLHRKWGGLDPLRKTRLSDFNKCANRLRKVLRYQLDNRDE